MCGICGQIKIASDEPVDQAMIRRMSQTIFHRGPDDQGYFFDRSLGFGFRRLSIIDLAGGHQPMSDAEQSVWIIFNGEIYNYKELRAELEGRGHKFRTNSDTEVIIHGYKQWGTEVFNHLNGMFGLAIWDVKRKRLVVARDAMGIKLIYYRLAGGKLTFGSEIRPVLAAEDSRPEVDPAALNLFLRFRYTPSPLTIYQGVRKLAPGTLLVVENGNCREERWYNFRPEPFSRPPDDRDATEELFELYRAAVKRHLLADVPVGILLSGGLDSGLLLALMNEHGRDWPAYTIGYGSSFADDELVDAAETSSLLGARHTQVRLDQEEFEKSLPNIVRCLEEPVAASSIVPMYFVCQRARQDVELVEQMTRRILELFPRCPPREAHAIAAHTATRGSGRVGRSEAGRNLEERALFAAVAAAIRHQRTNYDELLASGAARDDARRRVGEKVQDILDAWQGG